MNFYLAQVQIRSSGYTFSSPVQLRCRQKIFIAEKCSEFMTLFLHCWQKQVKSFLLLVQPSNFFFVNRESWQMALLLFWSWKMTCNVFENCFQNDFFPTLRRYVLRSGRSRKYFSIKAKQFFNQTDLEVVVSLWTKMLSKLIFDCRTRFRNDWVGKCNTTFKHRLDLESTKFFGSIGLLVQPQNFPKVFVIEMLVL